MVELEEFWSNLMDELRQRNIPAFSLVSVHGFPISFDGGDLVVGVKENFQSTLQNKVEHIQGAAAAVLGRTISVRIKAVSQTAQKAQPRPKERAPAAKPQLPDPEEAERATARSQPNQNRPETSAIETAQKTATATLERTVQIPVEPPINSSSMVDEAYKLFEGPGSRRIR